MQRANRRQIHKHSALLEFVFTQTAMYICIHTNCWVCMYSHKLLCMYVLTQTAIYVCTHTNSQRHLGHACNTLCHTCIPTYIKGITYAHTYKNLPDGELPSSRHWSHLCLHILLVAFCRFFCGLLLLQEARVCFHLNLAHLRRPPVRVYIYIYIYIYMYVYIYVYMYMYIA